MSSAPSARRPSSLALRLTFWYSGLFAISCALAFVIVYVITVTTLKERRDADLTEDIADFGALYRSEGVLRVEREMRLDTLGNNSATSYFRLWERGGQLRLATDLTAFPGLGAPPTRVFESGGAAGPILATLQLPLRDDSVRVVYGAIAGDLLLEIAESTEEDDELVAELLRALVAPLVAVIFLGVPIGWFLARRALRGVEAVTRTAAAIAGAALDQRVAALDQRVPVQGEADELARLAEVFNAMLDRIQALVVGLHEMADHLAHDLRSPLTRIRAAAELAQASGRGDATDLSLAATATEECDRLLELINTNLEITQTESGAAYLRLVDVDLVALTRDACDLFQSVAEDRQITLTAALPERCTIPADRQRLQRVIANLLDNALKYTSRGGRVTITLLDEISRVRLRVEDSGIGILPDETSRIFERFYRSDRSRSEQGNGLGLSLCLANVRAHGGELSVESEPGRGSTFAVTLFR